MGYVDKQRAMLMRRLEARVPGFQDPGWLFCKENGEKLDDRTITKLFSIWKHGAGITQRAHPHMLRHRWITLQLVRLLEELQQLGAISADLLTTALSRLAFLSGHKDKESLWSYVDFAAEEMMLLARKRGTRAVSNDLIAKFDSLVSQLEALHQPAGASLEVALLKELRANLAIISAQASSPQGPIGSLMTMLRDTRDF